MDSSAYDAVSRLSIGSLSEQRRSSLPEEVKKSGFRTAGNAVIAMHRIEDQMFGKRWSELSPEGQQEIRRLKQDRRQQEQQRRAGLEKSRVTIRNIERTLRRNSETPANLQLRGLSLTTDLTSVQSGEMGWTKCWRLSPSGSQPILSSKAQYHNRCESGAWVSQEDLEKIGVIYIKLPFNNLKKLDELCSERGYVKLQKEKLTIKSPLLDKWYSEHFNTSEAVVYVDSGACYFDFRDLRNEFIRLHAVAGDCLIIPPGIFYRGCLDQSQTLSLIRMLLDVDSVPIHKSVVGSQSHPVRASYLSSRRRNSVLTDNNFMK